MRLCFADCDTLGEPLLVYTCVSEGLFDGVMCGDSDTLVNADNVGAEETDTD